MEIALALLPLLTSLLLGFLVIERIFPKGRLPGAVLLFFLSAGLGLGLSSELLFYSMAFLDQFNRWAALTVHAFILGVLLYQFFYRRKQSPGTLAARFAPVPLTDWGSLGLIILMSLPLFMYIKFFPYGGWDAWQVWNFKAKFIFLAGGEWQNMLAPDQWRTSPHYPLLLPLINVWGWVLMQTPSSVMGQMVAMVFTFLTAGVLTYGLKELTGKKYTVVSAFVLLTIPFFLQLSASQYCEIVTAYYLLCGIIALTMSHTHGSTNWAFLGGLFLGLLGFTKNEGSLAAAVMIMIAIPYLIHAQRLHKLKKNMVVPLLAGGAVTFLPVIIFELIFSPGNQTFVNGLVSKNLPSDIFRIKMALAFLWVELLHAHWGGIWGIVLAGMVLSLGNCFRRRALLTPLFLLCYLGIIIVYYYLNTYFEILWWLQVTLHRVIYSLAPVALFWACYGAWMEKPAR